MSGPAAYRWIDSLARSRQTLWQILPLGPTGYGDSPYQCFSAFAGNTYTTDNTNVSGDSEIQFSSCAIERASRGSSVITRAKQRGFAEVIQ